MWEELSMGSQTLEILRQGVWASITGGWFYDPSQNFFCNTFHLYIWMFLLCFPYTCYVYFPPSKFIWYIYCCLIAIGLSSIKFGNYFLHHIYDTTECITETIEEHDYGAPKRSDEAIELQDLSKPKNEVSLSVPKGHNSALQLAGPSTDSLESSEQPEGAVGGVLNAHGTIDLKADVHRRNSTESSGSNDSFKKGKLNESVFTNWLPDSPEREQVVTRSCVRDQKRKPKKKGDSFVKNDEVVGATRINNLECQEKDTEVILQQRPSIHSMNSEPDSTSIVQVEDVERRHSNFTNCSLNYLPIDAIGVQNEMIPSGSLELGYIDKNPNQALNFEGFYFQQKNKDARRFRSAALEPCCPPPNIPANTNSLEIIGCKTNKNPLPPPSTTLTRNQHLNLCRYYGSEIVYPIAEQSDEHQTSHGPDTDVESLPRGSDSEFEETNQGSNSPLIYVQFEKIRKVPYVTSHNSKMKNEEPLESVDNSSSSVTEPAQAHSTYASDNDISEKKLSENETATIKARADFMSSASAHSIVRKKNVKKYKRRKSDSTMAPRSGNSSSLVQLNLDWLFDVDGVPTNRLTHRKEPLKNDNEWSSTTTVSLEQDVSKVLQETIPAVRSLGAIPKKLSYYQRENERRPPKAESVKCKACSRCKSDLDKEQSLKEHKVTQTGRGKDSPDSTVEEPEDQSSRNKENLEEVKQGNDESKAGQPKSEEASSSGSNNELSVLIPPATPLLSAFLNSRKEFTSTWVSENNSPRLNQRNRPRRTRTIARRTDDATKREDLVLDRIMNNVQNTTMHTAKSFNDTSEGAMHCFVDECGNWITYTFQEKGNKREVHPSVGLEKRSGRRKTGETQGSREPSKSNMVWGSDDSVNAAAITTLVGTRCDNQPNNRRTPKCDSPRPPSSYWHNTSRRRPASVQEDVALSTLRDIATAANPDNPEIIMLGNREGNNGTPTRTQLRFIKVSSQETKVRTKNYYKLKLLPWKLTLDRLGLLALLDRNLTKFETMLSVILGILVSVLGAILLYLDFYKDLTAFIFCFIMASAQYSLLKSVQPDAASPTHGFNRVIAYSRPIYFCLFTFVVVILHFNIVNDTQTGLITARDFFKNFVLFFPLIFSFGLFPQINTFLMYLLEQADIHLFGGNAMCNLIGSFYCVFRSIIAVLLLNGLAYGGLSESKTSQHVLFSIFLACLVAGCYHLSRSSSDPLHVFNLAKKHLWPTELQRDTLRDVEASLGKREENANSNPKQEQTDPLPKKLQETVNARLKNDLILCAVIGILIFSVHSSTVFTVLQSELCLVLWSIAAGTGLVLHYIIPQFRKQLPWMCLSKPILRSYEYLHYQIREPAKTMWYEAMYVYLCFFERNILYPLMALSVLTKESPLIVQKYGTLLGSFITVVCGMKFLRNSYSNQNCQYLIVTFTALMTLYDFQYLDQTFLVMYFFVSIAYFKIHEFLLKLQFVITYIAPWQITWGSAFHAFAQPFSVPHSAMLFTQAALSAILSTPLNPFLGSAIFFTSYVRPVKFWERDYNTRRVDHSNTSLSSHLDRNLGADDNNLNSIFYEHLTRSLQHSLCGDLAMGRWGNVNQGDVFVMASDYLNCLVHIIELGNGLVTFQMRGLEFRGTYCQQREVEAITEGVEDNDGCLCFETGHLPNMLSVNAAFAQRWLAWEVTASKYILEGYSISDNSVVSMLQVFEFRKVLVSYYVKSIIFYTTRSPKLEEWLNSDVINKTLRTIWKPNFVDLDPVFNYNIDEDYDLQHNGMTKTSFMSIHGDWINYCLEKRGNVAKKQRVILLCFALSLLGRRTLGAVSHNMTSSVEFFLYGLHALFKGDFRITCARDEWVFTDMDLLKTVVAPAVRMSLKLHQDHFMTPDEYEILPALYEAICKHEQELVISHEGDPAWRNAVLSGTPSLLALRHVFDEGTDEYKIIMLNKRYLSFRVIKINKECVRGLWAGQQQELVYLRNRNPERGSIQNAKQALRNIINSSCDQPIGYPIYVSPLTTSYADTNEAYSQLVGSSVSVKKIKNYFVNLFSRIRKRCVEGCSSGASNREEISMGHEGVYAMTPMAFTAAPRRSTDSFRSGGSVGRVSTLSRTSLGGNRGSLVSMGKPTGSTIMSLACLFKEREERASSITSETQSQNTRNSMEESPETPKEPCENEFVGSRVKIIDPNLVYDCINLGRRIDVSWPTEYMRCRGGRSYWKDWIPEVGMEGPVVHKWTPFHRDPNKRSHVDRTILLVQIEDKFIPIADSGVQDLGPEV
ncbi:hypothetical protein ABEB36_005467 [Hypothenemus hampei]|uniref:Pecanex-like protein n=1 Tax=Hypothenemus hampei TaxID=57062 RepID=A0ABD1F1D0_HYPHA